ncbi:MAG: cob(I)yrinic acid a,c-diamide adenosyltransferase [Bacteriovoracaceae bacterium]
MSKVYTKTGDKGETSLVNGKRVNKFDPRIDLYGDVDELNSYLGLLIANLKNIENGKMFTSEIDYLIKMQSSMFNIGSFIACESEAREKFKIKNVTPDLIAEMEKKIDLMDVQLKPLSNFVLPGGNISSAMAHILRTTTRKIERKLLAFKTEHRQEISDELVIYFNRLSDFFFILSRFINFKSNIQEILWKNE